ncbi:MAG: HEAT repeat domain-containing protein [Thermoplasmatales archaeon]|nr:HEAT repeat domain-containing protein [Thermoplasmatales archaeon]
MTQYAEWLAGVEADLRAGKDRLDDIDELFQATFLGTPGEKAQAVWCIAKMGQNKVHDRRILDLLIPMAGDGDQSVRESVAWGIGEAAGAGLHDERSVGTLLQLLGDGDPLVRGMAAWAAGRLRKKLGISDPGLDSALEGLLGDRSAYVRKSAVFGLGREG